MALRDFVREMTIYFLFSWLKSSWRPASAVGGVASSWVGENPGGGGLSSSGRAGAPPKSGSRPGQEQRGCSPEQMDLPLPLSAPALPGAGPALSRWVQRGGAWDSVGDQFLMYQLPPLPQSLWVLWQESPPGS